MYKFGCFEYKENDVDVKLFLFPSIPKLKRFINIYSILRNES